MLLLLSSAFLAGALNAVAGGGTIFTFPALMLTGMPAIAANATSKVGVWPGAIASAVAYRRQIAEYRHYLPLLLPISLVGGWLGVQLLLVTPKAWFEAFVPWLLLFATLLFAFGKKIKFSRFHTPNPDSRTSKIAASFYHFLTSVYGGFFGAGIGIFMLSMMEMLGLKNIHGMNGLKTVLGAAMHSAAVLAFIMAGAVVWHEAALLIVGGVLGGYLGARLALKLPQHHVRSFVIAVGLATSVYFFVT